MTREIALIVYALSGEPRITTYATEWPCVKAAEVLNAKGEMAFCFIQSSDDIKARLEKYPEVPLSKDMASGWGGLDRPPGP